MKVINMAEKTGDSSFSSPKQALEEAILCIGNEKEGAFNKGKKLLILCLDDTDGQYKINFINAQMKMSECVSLCEVAKHLFLSEMNY